MFREEKKSKANIIIKSIFLFVCLFYLSFLSGIVVFRPSSSLLTFNSMMEHMLHGQFDIDPDIDRAEGYLRNGKVYAYWGIFPALLRLPVLVLPHGGNLDITQLSCIVALALMLFINYKSIVYLSQYFSVGQSWLRPCFAFVVALSGAQVCFLRFSVYQEVCFWAIVFGFLYVHWAMRACLDPAQTPRALLWMSVSAGLALLTRVSMGVGLYAAISLFGLLTVWRCMGRLRQAQGRAVRQTARVWLGYCGLAVAVLVFFVGVVAYVNEQRWGNPLTFVDYHSYLMNRYYPDRVLRAHQYGLFNINRIPLGFIYFFVPVWVFKWGNGHLILSSSFHRLVDVTEMPPSSFFLTDGFLLLFSGIFVWSVVRRRTISGVDSTAAILNMAGLLVAPLLMMMAISMNFRYRAEFYPIIMFTAFLGAVVVSKKWLEKPFFKYICIALVCISIFSSFAAMVLYKKSGFGVPKQLMTMSVWEYYKGW